MSIVLQERDFFMLRTIASFGGITPRQLFHFTGDKYPGTSMTHLYARVRGFVALGAVSRVELMGGAQLLCVTHDGLRLLGIGGRTPRPRLAQMRHDLALVDIAYSYARRAPHLQQLTDPMLRRLPSDEQARLCTPRLGGGGIYVPDLVLVNPATGSRGIVELETSRKNTDRLVKIMRSHVAAHHRGVSGVYYLADARQMEHVSMVAERVNVFADEIGAPFHVRVTHWEVMGDATTATAAAHS